MIGLYALNIDSPVSYVAAVLLPALDVLLPWLPSETVVIALGAVTAGSVSPRIGLLVALAALGAFLGDNVAYLVAAGGLGSAVAGGWAAGGGVCRLAWAQRSLDRFGARIIVACRFVPGGRTAVTLTCGLTGYPRRRFVPVTAWRRSCGPVTRSSSAASGARSSKTGHGSACCSRSGWGSRSACSSR